MLVADILEEQRGEDRRRDARSWAARRDRVAVDTSSPADNDAMVATAVQELGGVDVLVTAAGISHQDYRSDEPQLGALAVGDGTSAPVRQRGASSSSTRRSTTTTRVLDVNLTGTMLSMQSAVR